MTARREVTIGNRLGLHARAAAKFVRQASAFRATIAVIRGDARVDGKSILGLLTLAANRGTRLLLVADGDDEERAIEALAALVARRFDEVG